MGRSELFAAGDSAVPAVDIPVEEISYNVAILRDLFRCALDGMSEGFDAKGSIPVLNRNAVQKPLQRFSDEHDDRIGRDRIVIDRDDVP